ncbi:MAG: hypothetical protein JWO52_7360 [Gammaproteobacteria bacterium]|jgi:uncharacterized protein (DUF1697 family)|nr:hypothetical protein [Gammaproteobacteria bacterium]
MPAYAAFLRGVSPLNAKMSQLRECFEAAGCTNVKTVLGSGNVVFQARSKSRSALERQLEAAMQKDLGRVFATTLRSIDELAALVASDPYKTFRLAPNSKRIVTLLHVKPKSRMKLPIELDGARILCVKGTEIFSAYVPSPQGPVFMSLIEKTFGKDLTTRTWDTVGKVVKAGGG